MKLFFMILASSAVAALNFLDLDGLQYGLGLGFKDKEQRLRWFTSPHPQESAQAQAQAHTKTSQRDLDSSSSVQKSISLRVGNCILALNQGDGDYLPGHSRGRPVQFLHIPKAGGTSVQKYVKEMAEPANIRVWWHDGGGSAYNPPMNKGVFVGHRGFGYSQTLAVENPITIVVLRDPVDRMISWFDYILQSEEPMFRRFWRSEIRGGGITLDQVVESYDLVLREDPNKLLPSGSASFELKAFHRVLRAQRAFLCGYDCMGMESVDDQQMLRRAAENLEKIDCVGVLENLDDLLLQMKTYLDFIPREVTSFPHYNEVRRGGKSNPTRDTLLKLKSYVKEEQLLYQRARELSFQRTAQAKACF